MWWLNEGVGFRYSFSALKDRHTAVEVSYVDRITAGRPPRNWWKTRKPYCATDATC